MREIGFELGGKTYPVPELDTFDMDEAQLLYDYSGVAIEDFALPDPDEGDEAREEHEKEIESRVRNPAFKRALFEIAVRRGNPTMPWKDVAQLVRGANMVDVLAAFAEAELADEIVSGGDANPPEVDSAESTPPPSELSGNDSDDSKLNSGEDSPTTSNEPENPLANTGATRSVISSPA